MGNKAYVEAQDCRNCRKHDEHGGCIKPGMCIYVDRLADGNTRIRENTIDPRVSERMGEGGYLSCVEKMDITRRKKIFDKNPVMSKIITMLIAKVPWKDIESSLHVSRHTVSKAKRLWQEMKAKDVLSAK